MSECAAYGCLARAGRSIQEHSAFWFQAQLGAERIIGERQHNMNLEAAHNVVYSSQVVQVHFLDLREINVACQPLRAEVFNETVC